MNFHDGYRLYCCGSRGSRSVEGHMFNEFGGCTSCYILKRNDYALVLDCGTGFSFAGEILKDCTRVDLILTHMHYDHILGLLDWGKMPSGAKVNCYSCFDEWFGNDTIKEFLKPPFWPVCYPINTKTVKGNGEILSLNEGSLKVQFYPAPHPNEAKLLIITAGEISDDHGNQLVVMADCESSDGLCEQAIKNCNTLIYDGMYTDGEYKQHVGWGHSTWEEGCRLAERVGCTHLIITHHEPSRTDSELRLFESEARKTNKETDFARSGQSWDFPYASVNEKPENKTDNEAGGTKGNISIQEKLSKHIDSLMDKLESLYMKRTSFSHTVNIASCAIMGLVSLFMTVVNIFTGFHLLMLSTLIFGLLCLVDVALLYWGKNKDNIAMSLFALEMVALFSFFIVVGTPEGFSIVWLLLLPTAGLFVFGTKHGVKLCFVMMLIQIFFLWTPMGQNCLMFDYSESFKLRFPLAFTAFFVMSVFLEEVRQRTSAALINLKNNQEQIISRQTSELRNQNTELLNFNTKLELRNDLLSKTFGRFLPDDVITSLLNTGEGFKLSGEKRVLTVLQSDIRGFSSISNRMDPLSLVNMLNNYLGEMTEIVQKYNGVVIEFIGDGILAVFGSLNQGQNHADDAIACAIEMQKRMAAINSWNNEKGYEYLEIGIGIHTGDAVIGIIGSEKHLKYDTIGPTINLGSRIEGYSVGTQILVSGKTKDAAKSKLKIEGEYKVMPKGSDGPMSIYCVTGIGGKYDIECPFVYEKQINLKESVNVRFVRVRGDYCEMTLLNGVIFADSKSAFSLKTEEHLQLFDNIRIECACGLIGKVVKQQGDGTYVIRYTSKPAKFTGFENCNCTEAEKYFTFNL